MPQTFTGNTLFTLLEKLCPFRFEVCVTNENNVVIWIENRESKQQWQTSSLELKEFVTSDNAIPKASADDYAARFAACLENDDESSNYHHSLSVEAKGGVRTLKLSVPLSWGSHTLTVDYIFSLTQVPLERVDILGARLRDVEDLLQTDRAVLQTKLITSNVSFEEKVNGLAERVKELEHQIELRMKPVCVHAILTAESQNIPHRSVPWMTDVCSDYKNIRIHPDGRIQLSLAGLYAVSICIVHSRSSNDTVYALTKCGKILATCAGYSPNGTYVSSPLQKIVKVNADEELCVEYKASGYVYSAGSYISITKL